jgi:3-oxoacyl-[acyl-carrier protein] reductase
MVTPDEVDASPFAVGQRASLAHEVSRSEILAFADLSGDDNLLHVDDDFARSVGHSTVVSHGMLTAALVSRVIGTRLPGHGSLWMSQEFEFSGTVQAGDVITATVEVTRVRSEERILDLVVWVRNQFEETVLRGAGRVQYPEFDPEPAPVDAATNDRVAVVMGASGAIGLEICRSLIRAGVKCIGIYRSRPDALEKLGDETSRGHAGRRLHILRADLGRDSERTRLIDQVGTLSETPTIIVQAASHAPARVPAVLLTRDSITSAVLSELLPLVDLTRAFSPGMKSAGFGRIIAVGSTTSVNKPDPGWAAYAMSKASVAAYLKSLALELATFGITSNMVVPGLMAQGMTSTLPRRLRIAAAAETPSRRLATPREVAEAVTFLASDSAGGINGQQVLVDGGREMPW